ncbi:MAG: trigger factor [Flavobacteriales bacterium]
MNITQEKIDDLNAVLSVEVQEADYREIVEGALKKHQRTAKMQGFRPGKVPFSLVRKMYEPSVKVDEINRLVSKELEKYIADNKIEIIGQPLPKANSGISYDFTNGVDFKFIYELGIAPSFDIALNKVELTQYKINVDDTLVDKFVTDIAKRYGKMSAPEVASLEDMLYIDFSELAADGSLKEGGISKMSVLPLSEINKKVAEQFVGKKKDDEVTLIPSSVYDDKAKVAAMLGTTTDAVASLGSFKAKVLNISKLEAAELNQDLFDKVYGAGVVNSVEEFRAKVKAEASEAMVSQEFTKLQNDAIQYLLDNTKFNLPDTFVKKWLVAASQKPTTPEAIENEYAHYQRGLKWQLIENKLIKENDLKVEFEELKAKAEELVKANFRQYGQNIDDEQLAPIVTSVLQREEERRGIYDALYTEKIVNTVKSKGKISEKTVSYDEFTKLVSQQNNQN